MAAPASAAVRSFHLLMPTSSYAQLPRPSASASIPRALLHAAAVQCNPVFLAAAAGVPNVVGTDCGLSLRRSRRQRTAECRAQLDDGSFGGDGLEAGKALERVLKEKLSKEMFDDLAEKILEDEQSKALLKDFSAAAERVANAKHELELIDRQERELAQILAQTAENETESWAAVAERERDVLKAEEELKSAERALVTARAGYSAENLAVKWADDDVDENSERVESGVAAAISTLAGTLASIPFFLAEENVGIGSLLSIGGVAVSCALYGVVYRYILRRDLGNIQLKIGAAAAFTIVRGIGQVDALQLQLGFFIPGIDDIILAALKTSEGLLAFGFSTLALDYCFKMAILSPFPSKKKSPS